MKSLLVCYCALVFAAAESRPASRPETRPTTVPSTTQPARESWMLGTGDLPRGKLDLRFAPGADNSREAVTGLRTAVGAIEEYRRIHERVRKLSDPDQELRRGELDAILAAKAKAVGELADVVARHPTEPAAVDAALLLSAMISSDAQDLRAVGLDAVRQIRRAFGSKWQGAVAALIELRLRNTAWSKEGIAARHQFAVENLPAVEPQLDRTRPEIRLLLDELAVRTSLRVKYLMEIAALEQALAFESRGQERQTWMGQSIETWRRVMREYPGTPEAVDAEDAIRSSSFLLERAKGPTKQ